ncbi:hypothetical protein ISF_09273 [Cordyceps fumosorosea ARSEF 2679]|uniref:Secreted protein n=1 Tax=Cordyceps fumosorosea (strain ARSEF 2679) TaxID=1081104 RepID=A0A162M9G1_CORFA|nr:hypothetical protein ISF_09273 [Cordyceps fumosorosea ARSEF 2679]OAA52890.1 hypothetical protein ISF_09273 [Cordyceps fumosorosea ARSEF 2679]
MVRIAAAAVLAFAVSAMALSGDAAAALSPRDDAPAGGETRKESTPEDIRKWMETIAEAAEELRKMALEHAKGTGGESA